MKSERYEETVIEFVRACKRLMYETDQRIRALENEIELLRVIDTSILEAKHSLETEGKHENSEKRI